MIKMYKRKIKIGSAIVSGAALGFIGGNVPGAIIGANAGYQIANKVLDEDGNTNYKKLF